MSLQRRIAAAAAFGVAAVCLILVPVGYLSTRAKMHEQIRQELMAITQPYVQKPHPHGANPPNGLSVPPQGNGSPGNPTGGNPNSSDGDTDNNAIPTCTVRRHTEGGGGEIGAPTGYIQVVCPDGRVIAGPTGRVIAKPKLPVTAAVKKVARTLTGPFFFTADIGKNRTDEEIYVVPDKGDHHVIEAAVQLTSTNDALRSLLFTYALLVAVGIVLAGLIGALVARSALAPIRRFTSQTEQITSSLDTSRRLDEEGAIEIRRLAASFNQTLDALERSVEAQRHLIADASHELRTPIAALRSNIQIFLEADQLPPEEQEGLQEAILAELDDLTQLVSDVLSLARGSTPNEAVEEIELEAIVREATDRAIRRSPNLTFDSDLEPTVINNSADRVSRAVTNVIDNARKWSPPGGTVEITLRDGVLTVRDHGPGFGAEDLAHVFERFYRADEARRMPGSGLGLAIVKQAAEAHGGFATVANAPDGGGIVQVSFGSARVGTEEPAAARHD